MGKVAILVYVDPNPVRSKVDEFRMLAEVAGYSIKDVVVQRRAPDSRFYVGAGKLREIKGLINDGVGYLIAYHQLKPSQSFNLSRELALT